MDKIRKALVATFISTLALLLQQEAPAQPNDQENGPLEVGYVIITPASGDAGGLVVFETFGMKQGNQTMDAGVLPSGMCTRVIFFVDIHGKLSHNLGVAISNPGDSDANILMTLRDADGLLLAEQPITVLPGRQTSRFVTEFFADQPSVPQNVTGSIIIESDIPVAMIGFRLRGMNFSTLPTTILSELSPLPDLGDGVGGPGALILPHFAAGGGWSTEIVIVNTGTESITVRVDLFGRDASPLIVRLNGESNSSFTDIVIPPGGVFILSPKNGNGNGPF
jgi:hypothetical protein